MNPRIDGKRDLKYPVLNARAQRVWGSTTSRDYDGTLHPFAGMPGEGFIGQRIYALVYGEGVVNICVPDTFRWALLGGWDEVVPLLNAWVSDANPP